MNRRNLNRFTRFSAVLGLCAALLAVPALAQETTATLTGTVTDKATRSPVGGATVLVTSPNLQGQRTIRTDASGFYRLGQLPTGTYRISFVKGGFKTLTYAEAELRVGQTVRLNAELTPRPAEPAQPTEPAQPSQPAEPSQPAQPAEPQPSQPAQP